MIILFTLTKCGNCGAHTVINVGVDVDPNRGFKEENIIVKESFAESDFVDYIVGILNKQLQSGAKIESIRRVLINSYGISESYADRLESLILPKLITAPKSIQINI